MTLPWSRSTTAKPMRCLSRSLVTSKKRSAALAETFNPDQAAEVGFLDHVVDENLLSTALVYARAASLLDAGALVKTRAQLYDGLV